MTAVVFLGPSLPVATARRVLDADYRPPCRRGDVYRAVRDGARIIGIVDGLFERVPSVWHKEILHAMANGVRVIGAASMGALRAAELHAFGMEGVGPIFEAFRDGVLDGDDEVAVGHGPQDAGYPLVSEALVNIRATLARAIAEDVLAADVGNALADVAKAVFFKDRTYASVLARAHAAGLPAHALERLRAWLPAGAIDQKREDAMALIERVAACLAEAPSQPAMSFRFAATQYWHRLVQRIDGDRPASQGGTSELSVGNAAVAEELRLVPDLYRALRAATMARLLAPNAPVADAGAALEMFRLRRGFSPEDLREFLRSNDIDRDRFARTARDEAALDSWWQRMLGVADAYLIDSARLADHYPRLASRAREKAQRLEQIGMQAASVDDTGLGVAELVRWFAAATGQREQGPADWVRHLDLPSVAALSRMLAREYCFRRQLAEDSPGIGPRESPSQ